MLCWAARWKFQVGGKRELSDIDDEDFAKNDAVIKKLMKCDKQLKPILDSIKSIEFEIDAALLNFNMAINKVDAKGHVEEKERWIRYG